jgi:hypothetical protein
MFDYGDIVEGKPSRIVDPVPDHARGKIITACNRDPKELAKGHVEILTPDGNRYWMVAETVKMVMPKNPKYPECDKLAKVRAARQAIAEFLAWATSEKGFKFGQEVPVELESPGEDADIFEKHGHSLAKLASPKSILQGASESTIEKLLYEYFEIDPKKLEEERRLMLEYQRYH